MKITIEFHEEDGPNLNRLIHFLVSLNRLGPEGVAPAPTTMATQEGGIKGEDAPGCEAPANPSEAKGLPPFPGFPGFPGASNLWEQKGGLWGDDEFGVAVLSDPPPGKEVPLTYLLRGTQPIPVTNEDEVEVLREGANLWVGLLESWVHGFGVTEEEEPQPDRTKILTRALYENSGAMFATVDFYGGLTRMVEQLCPGAPSCPTSRRIADNIAQVASALGVSILAHKLEPLRNLSPLGDSGSGYTYRNADGSLQPLVWRGTPTWTAPVENPASSGMPAPTPDTDTDTETDTDTDTDTNTEETDESP